MKRRAYGGLLMVITLSVSAGVPPTAQAFPRAAAESRALSGLASRASRSAPQASELGRRNAMALRAAPALEKLRADPSWGGVWLDQAAGGVLVIQFTGDVVSRIADLRRLLPPGTDFRVEKVSQTLAELEALQSQIVHDRFALRAHGADVTGTAIDVSANHVVVDVAALTPTARAVISARFGSQVKVAEGGRAVPDACPITGCLPIKAGMGATSPDGVNPCTVGYLAKRLDTSPDRLVFVTAGHCVEYGVEVGGAGADWSHYQSGVKLIGNASTPGGGAIETWHEVPGGTGYSDADVGLVNTGKLSDANRRVRNLLFWKSGMPIASIAGVLPWSWQFPGMYVCRMGVTTGAGGDACGYILETNGTRESCANCDQVWVDGVVVTDIDADLGDSGGPYFTVHQAAGGPWQATLVGTHVHSFGGYNQGDNSRKGWYSPVDRGIDAMEAEFPGLNLEVCVTSSCGLPDPI